MTLEADAEFEYLIDYLREARGVDFTGYKRPSLVRRVAKRCAELGIDSFSSYLDYLQVHADEFPILFDKILINVTEFFRDPEAWDYLAKNIIPPIAAKDGPIRVWSAGSASGEEAYSAAITFCEAMGHGEYLDRVKIYATDIDEEALNRAVMGYTDKELESLDAGLKNRYFERQGTRFSFRQSLRRPLIFGRHDLMTDAPISRLDLLICRNTLIYFTAEAQGRILARFHYALNNDGYLFLGRAEMLLTHSALFVPIELKQRIFAKVARVQVREAPAGNFEVTEHVSRHVKVRELATEGLLVPQLVVDANGSLVSANSAARGLFNIPPGDIGRRLRDLEISYKPIDLRTPLENAGREHRTVLVRDVEFPYPDGTQRVFDVHFTPLFDDGGPVTGTSITFLEMTQNVRLRAELERAQHDMETAYEELQSSNEELEITNEELQSTVEELETTNEELQSSNEELETTNEELESTNAELQGINTELRARTDDIQRLNTLLLAVTGNIEVGAVVLDSHLNVQLWNERAADLWGIRADETVGRPFFHLDIGLPVDGLRQMVNSVMTQSQQHHQEQVVKAVTRRGRTIQCRVMAHALSDERSTAGIVLLLQELEPKQPEGPGV